MKMPSNYQTFANDIKFQSKTYLIQMLWTYLIRSKVKTAPPPPLICLIDMDLSDIWCIKLQSQTLPVISF